MRVCGAQPAAQTAAETLITEDHELSRAATETTLRQHLETLIK